MDIYQIKKTMKQSLFLLFLIFYTLYAKGQNISQELIKVDKYRVERQLHKALDIITEQEEYAKKYKPEALPEIYFAYTRFYITIDDFEKAKLYAQKAEDIGNKSKNKEATAYGWLAQMYYNKQTDRTTVAVQYSKRIQEYVEKNPSSANPYLPTIAFYLLYAIHSKWEDYKITNKYADLAIKWAKKSNNPNILMDSYFAKSNSMRFSYEKTHDKKYKDSITYYLYLCQDIYNDNPKPIIDYNYAIINVNLADHFFTEMKKQQKKALKDSVLKYLDKNNTLPLTSDFAYEVRANMLGIRAMLAIDEGDTQRAKQYLETALTNLTKEEKRPATYTIISVLTALIELYKQEENYQKALEHSETLQIYNKKEFDKETANQVRILEDKFENERLKENLSFSKRKNLLGGILILLLLIICFLSVAILYFYRKNSRNTISLLHEKEKTLVKEKELAEQNLKLEQEIKIRLEIEQEKLQKEALIRALEIQQKNNAINSIKQEINNEPEYYNIKKVLKKVDITSEISDADLKNIHPDFFKNLGKLSGNKLSKRDEKICAYIFIGADNKTLANIFNVEVKSIRMAKYRIKQKLGLDASTDIETFLKTLPSNENSL